MADNVTSNCPTPHNSAIYGDFGKTVLMPGDPLRSKFIAENFLENPVLVNNVRGIQGYTGTYKGVRVSVMASGMGMPSIAIYSHELFNFYGVENIIRVGSAGGMIESVKVRDIVAGETSFTDSNFAELEGFEKGYVPHASKKLLDVANKVAIDLGTPMKNGTLYSSEVFYSDEGGVKSDLELLAVEMESVALYLEAEKAGKNALAICTISDSLVTGESLDAQARQNSFTQMMEIALNTAVEIDKN